MNFKYLYTLFFFISLLLFSCATPKKTVIKGVNGPSIISDAGEIEKIDEDNIGNQTIAGMPVARLSNVGDEATIAFNTPVNFDVEIDTSTSVIITYFNNNDRTVTYKVVSKAEENNVVFNNLCDIYIIPDVEVNIKLIDNYNLSKNNKKKYKIILVPILDANCMVTGYLVRYDLDAKLRHCSSYQRIKEIENKFLNNCNKKGKSNCKRTNCLEYKYFGTCCP